MANYKASARGQSAARGPPSRRQNKTTAAGHAQGVLGRWWGTETPHMVARHKGKARKGTKKKKRSKKQEARSKKKEERRKKKEQTFSKRGGERK